METHIVTDQDYVQVPIVACHRWRGGLP